MFFDVKITEKNWVCFKCEDIHPNTLRYCPTCNIAKNHSDNLRETSKKKEIKFISL